MTFTFADGSTNATSWQWDFGDTQTSTSQNPTNVYTTPGTYTVTLIATNGCGSDTITQVIVVDGISGVDPLSQVAVYPNPAHDKAMITFSGPVTDRMISITDLEGKLIRSELIRNIGAGGSYAMDLGGLAPGMYLLKTGAGSGDPCLKLVIQ
jgi:PKD repeat protein